MPEVTGRECLTRPNLAQAVLVTLTAAGSLLGRHCPNSKGHTAFTLMAPLHLMAPVLPVTSRQVGEASHILPATLSCLGNPES